MNADSLLLQSFNVTIIGMLVVFVFLILLVLVVQTLGKIVKVLESYFPQQDTQTAPISTDSNALLAVAIATAKRFNCK